jgi:hypothetical protein
MRTASRCWCVALVAKKPLLLEEVLSSRTVLNPFSKVNKSVPERKTSLKDRRDFFQKSGMERKMNSFMGVGTTGCSTLMYGRGTRHKLVLPMRARLCPPAATRARARPQGYESVAKEKDDRKLDMKRPLPVLPKYWGQV